MALVIETGDGVAGADSYQSLADARVLAERYGLTIDIDDTKAEVQLRQGYLNINTEESQLQGRRTHDIQTGAFPRTGVTANCKPIDADLITDDIKLAQVYAADGINSGAGTNEVNTGERLASFEVVGAYKESYQTGSNSSLNASIQGVTNALYPYTKAGYRASPCGSNGYAANLGRQNFGYID